MEGSIFNIQRFSIHDGPGVRTTVFFKGCNLRCFWCHNPESVSLNKQVQFFPEKCILCGKCVEVCPEGAQAIEDGKRLFYRERCVACGKCVDVCYARSLVMAGRTVTVEEVMQEVQQDRLYYDNSGGGVTFSGGEPLLQVDFLRALLVECKKLGLHTAVDTACNLPWDVVASVIPLADLFMVDVKVFDEEKHKAATGVSNKRIKENLARLADNGVRLFTRTPVIPGVNDDVEEMDRIAAFLESIGKVELIELLPFHHLGGGKFESLGQEYRAKNLKPPSNGKMNELVELFTRRGLNARAQGSIPARAGVQSHSS